MKMIYVYDLKDQRLLQQIDTAPNRKGLCEISPSGRMVLVCLGWGTGEVRVEVLEHYGIRMSWLIKAHVSDVACVALLNDGRLLATASTKGTLVRGVQDIARKAASGGIVLPNNRSPEWLVVRFRVPKDIQHIVAFGHQKNTVHVIGTNGRFYICKFDLKAGGEMTQMECHNFLRSDFAGQSSNLST
ncbi:UNVERIFIED_CONTAM: Autophagy-related protein 18a [Sesamum latifolium]|uniref:Autophagy-related protein 18a n=1 Tax=Sesamum latifolium TaxID=2727402 RepID=A0AAW2XNZ8_9LAMI